MAPGQARPIHPGYPAYAAPTATPRRPGGRNGWLIFLAVIFALAVAICSGLIAYRIANQTNDSGDNNNAGGGSGGAAQQTTGGAALAPAYDIPCEQYRWQKYEKVKADLRDSDYRVARRDVPGLVDGRVVDVTPCRAPKGSVVTVQVATGKVGDVASCGTIGGSVDCRRDRHD